MREGGQQLAVISSNLENLLKERHRLLWKVYNIQSGKTIKAGFESEDDAKDWLELKGEDFQDLYEAEEMDQDEVEEWLESQASEAGIDEDDAEPVTEEEDEPVSIGFGDEYYDGEDLTDDEDELTYVEDDELS